MRRGAFLEEIRERFVRHEERIRSSLVPLDEGALNEKPATGDWTIGQIVEHTRMAGDDYLPRMQEAVRIALNDGDPEAEVHHTLLGRWIAKAAGPNMDAPVPGRFVPRGSHFDTEAVDRLLAQARGFQDLTEAAASCNISSTKIGLAALPFFKVSIADGLLINAEHYERHLRQIESRISGQPGAAG